MLYSLKPSHSRTFPARRLALSTLIAIGLLLAIGCASQQPISTQLEDTVITTKVKARLAADPEVNPFEIDVDTNEGVVRLSGMVEELSTRREAVKLARNTKGVIRVIDEIRIGDPTTEEVLSDAGIVTKIKAKLTADPEINPFNIDVDSNSGVVTLSGRVSSLAHKQEAEKLARNTKGVKRVRNLLATGPR